MKKFIIALLFVFVATPALAARSYDAYDRKSHRSSASKTSKVYIGISGGQNKVDDPTNTNTSTGYSVFAGYSFNDYVAAELAYTNFGKLDTDVTTSTVLNSNAGSFSLVGSLPMGRFVSLFGKVGYASTTTEISVASVASPTESQTGATYGAGVQFNLGQTVAIRLGIDKYKIMVNALTYDSNFSNLGVMVKF